MYAENPHELISGLDDLVERGDVSGLVREIRKAVILMALESGQQKRVDLIAGLQEIADTLRASLD